MELCSVSFDTGSRDFSVPSQKFQLERLSRVSDSESRDNLTNPDLRIQDGCPEHQPRGSCSEKVFITLGNSPICGHVGISRLILVFIPSSDFRGKRNAANNHQKILVSDWLHSLVSVTVTVTVTCCVLPLTCRSIWFMNIILIHFINMLSCFQNAQIFTSVYLDIQIYIYNNCSYVHIRQLKGLHTLTYAGNI